VRGRIQRRATSGGGAGDPAAIGHHGHAAQFRDFLAAVRSGRRPLVDGHEGRRSVEIVLGIYQAARTGRAVTLPLRSDSALKGRHR
jgi:predicted dehydrogenase